jgi:hypothetical protein
MATGWLMKGPLHDPVAYTVEPIPSTPLDTEGVGTVVAPAKSDYIQSIDLDMLTEIAQAHNLLIHLACDR